MNRRFLRVKVMQGLYAYHHSDTTYAEQQKRVLKDIEELTDIYYAILELASEVTEYVLVDAEERSKKFILSDEDKNPNTRLSQNAFFAKMRSSVSYKEAIRHLKIKWTVDPEIVPSVFKQLSQSDAYCQYQVEGDELEVKVLKTLLLKIILRSVLVEQFLELQCITWQEDKEIIKVMLSRTLKNFEDGKDDVLVRLSLAPKEDESFVKQMFAKYEEHGDVLSSRIAQKMPNWDVERVAMMDIILMKMMLIEALYFPMIPVKVSLNEYMEIAKMYSTPKSALFINGVLDPICKELQQTGVVRKKGKNDK